VRHGSLAAVEPHILNRFSTVAVLLLALSLGQALGQSAKPSVGPESLFGLDNVIDVHIRIEPEEWSKLQPSKGTKMDFGVAFQGLMGDAIAGKHFHSEKSTRPGLAGYLGVDHQYGQAEITIDGETVKGIGLRYKGNGTFLQYVEGDVTRRLSFKIDFNEYDDELEFRGLTKVNLNNNGTDPSLMREPLSYELFREAGIHCSRVGYAKVSLTIPGKVDRKPHGLYTVVEQVDKRFLKDRYGSAKGLLMKPSTFGAFRYFGEEWDEYEVGFVPKTKPSEEQKQRVIEFARLIHKTEDDAFEEKVQDYLDVDQFLRFLAVNVLLSNLDSFLGGTQNHYIYLEPDSNKFQFFPWDMDISFGVFSLPGTPETRRKMSIDHPGGKGHTLIERVLNIPQHKKTYHDYLETYLKTIFAEGEMHQQIERVAEFVRPMVKINGTKATDRFDGVLADSPKWWEQHPLKYFVSKRRASVRRQLDGESEGHILFDEKPDLEPNWQELIAWGIALLTVLLLNFSGWLWGVIVGFRGSILWGFLNMFFYPLTPVIYGFGVHKELGRRMAIWSIFCAACFVALIVTAIVMGSE
jgi:spore coat protein CotH